MISLAPTLPGSPGPTPPCFSYTSLLTAPTCTCLGTSCYSTWQALPTSSQENAH